jgi:hypothetical protein
VAEILTCIEKTVLKRQEYPRGNLPKYLAERFPALVLKCYHPKTLFQLLLLRDIINELQLKIEFRDFFNTGLTCILRKVASVQTGWPYIAPKKPKSNPYPRNALDAFVCQINNMIQDINAVRRTIPEQRSRHRVFNADCRDTSKYFEDESADLIFTSPPYLNNFDYADRTRLEMYFYGHAKHWREISEKVRTKLITSATTQINRDGLRYRLSDGLRKDCPEVHSFLKEAVNTLSQLRTTKGGKKSYDYMVSGYFNDMYLTMRDAYRILKRGGHAMFVLGDSAPYGVYIPTDDIIGKIGVGVGFTSYHTSLLRTRGGKWKENPQRHTVALKESILTLMKE